MRTSRLRFGKKLRTFEEHARPIYYVKIRTIRGILKEHFRLFQLAENTALIGEYPILPVAGLGPANLGPA